MRLVKGTFLLTLGVCLLSSVFITASAQQGRERSTKKARAAAEQSARAARVFDQIMGTREKSIPHDLIDRAEAVAVFPGVLKGGFIVGCRGGHGVIIPRVARGLGSPALFELSRGTVWLAVELWSPTLLMLTKNIST